MNNHKILLWDQTIYIGNGEAWDEIISELNSKYNKILLVVDKQFRASKGRELSQLFSDSLQDKFVWEIILDAHTTTKNLLSVHFLLEYFHSVWLNRKSCVLAMWWGYVGDLVWVATGMYMRWIWFYQIPSTVMSQCDAVIGKVGVNLGSYKNVIWLFRSPEVIFCNIQYLQDLPLTERLLWFPEIIKHLLIRYDDADIIMKKATLYFNLIQQWVVGENFWQWCDMIKESLEIKYSFVCADPYDVNGTHKWLSLWHTFANVLETLVYKLRHGDAVMVGILMSLNLSAKIYQDSQIELIKKWLYSLNLNQHNRIALSRETIKSVLQQDKISANWELSFIILKKLGNHLIERNCEEEMVKDAFKEFITLYD